MTDPTHLERDAKLPGFLAMKHRELRDRAQARGLGGKALALARKEELARYLLDGEIPDSLCQRVEDAESRERELALPLATPSPQDDPLRRAIADAVSGLVKPTLDREAIVDLLDDTLESRLPALAEALAQHVKPAEPERTRIEIRAPGREPVEIDRAHELLPAVLETVQALGVAWLVGPKGSGKSTLARQVAEALGLGFSCNSCSEGMSEGHILGRMLFDGSFASTGFLERYEGGGVHLFDEVDNADPNVLNAINDALANGALSVPNRRDATSAKRSEDFVCIAASNTYGTGQGTEEYTGRTALDAAFRSRFTAATFFVDYDEALERELAAELGVTWLVPAFLAARRAAQTARLRRDLSTRALVHLGRLHRANPDAFDAGRLFDRLTQGWTGEERAKVEGPWRAEDPTR